LETILKRKRTSSKIETKITRKILIRTEKKRKKILNNGPKITKENLN
jgi:hypothetical protein